MSTPQQQALNKAAQTASAATDPAHSIWLGASAGTGKTYVLTRRILRLLLADHTLAPRDILGVTYTRAAAAEMQQRLRYILLGWATAGDDKLHRELNDLLTHPADSATAARARRLLFDVLDDPYGGVGLSTIHALCQSLLAQFPLEAGLCPGFTVVDDAQKADLLTLARQQFILSCAEGQGGEGAPVPGWVFGYFVTQKADSTIYDVLGSFTENRSRFMRLLGVYGSLEALLDATAKALGLPQTPTGPETLKTLSCPLPPEAVREHARFAASKLEQAGKNAQKAAHALYALAAGTPENIAAAWEAVFAGLWYSAREDGPKPPTSIAKKLTEDDPSWVQPFEAVTNWAQAQVNHANGVRSWLITAAYLHLGYGFMAAYTRLKEAQNALDFDDLIHHTHRLLHTEDGKSAWVRYRMDRKIKHLLLDEAQDTDHQQWQILRTLIDDFFAGAGQHDTPRTLFTVGDVKQAIYRFRGAQREVFAGMADLPQLSPLSMGVSFRSTDVILQFVDAVFADATRHRAIETPSSPPPLVHHAFHAEMGGTVELWPLEEGPVDDDDGAEATPDMPWALPGTAQATAGGTAHGTLFLRIATHLKEVLNNGTLVRGDKGLRPMRGQDVMILLRGRTRLAELVAALGAVGLPYTVADKIKLADDPVVADMLALVRFVASPVDDLSLLQVLRCPLGGFSDAQMDMLFAARSKGQTCWQALCALKGPGYDVFEDAAAWLKSLLKMADMASPHRLLTQALVSRAGRRRFTARLGADAGLLEPLDAFMDLTLQQNTTLWDFIHLMDQAPYTIKREAGAAPGAVRIMTVHASKGLQAPYVVLADCATGFYGNFGRETCAWQTADDGSDSLVLFRLPKGQMPPLQEQLDTVEKARLFDDEMRLLYVALTRAGERLLVAGVKPTKDQGQTWYNILAGVMEHITTDQHPHAKLPDGRLIFTLPDGQRQKTERYLPETTPAVQALPVPPWATANIPAEQTASPLVASGTGEEGVVDLMVDPAMQASLNRGILIHRLLELLPATPADERLVRGAALIAATAPELDAQARTQLLEQALGVIAAYPQLFGAQSYAETTLAARLAEGTLTGRVDNLTVEGDTVYIVDYKTTAHTPATVPAKYVRQLQIYARAAAALWPGKTIKTAILWTAATPPRLDWVE